MESQLRRPLLDRLYAVRDRLLESPVFQRFSATFPLTRPVANAQARALFDICAGFVYSQILAACVRLDLFRILAEGPRTAAEAARLTSLPPDAAERLLRAAAALRLASPRSGGRYGLGMLGAALHGNPGIAAMVEHHAMLYRDLEDPVALLRGDAVATQLAQFWPYAEADSPAGLAADRVDRYSALMAASQPLIAEDVLQAYPFGSHRRLLDVGGGEGAFICAAARRHPDLQFMLFDLPAVVRRAQDRFASTGISDRVRIHGGSCRRAPMRSRSCAWCTTTTTRR